MIPEIRSTAAHGPWFQRSTFCGLGLALDCMLLHGGSFGNLRIHPKLHARCRCSVESSHAGFLKDNSLNPQLKRQLQVSDTIGSVAKGGKQDCPDCVLHMYFHICTLWATPSCEHGESAVWFELSGLRLRLEVKGC